MFIINPVLPHVFKSGLLETRGYLCLACLVAGFVCESNHQDHFPEENFAAQTEERLVHQRADATLLGVEFVDFLEPRS